MYKRQPWNNRPWQWMQLGIIGTAEEMCIRDRLLTAEMLELIDSGVENIVCAQPFGCLPNHVAGKGMIRKIKSTYPDANIVAIDYDPGATEVNQENRIKLMLAVARSKMEKQRQSQDAKTALSESKV